MSTHLSHPSEILNLYIQSTIQKGFWPQFFLLVWPNSDSKSQQAQKIISNILWEYMYSDFLHFRDYSSQLGKLHTIPVQLNDSNKTLELSDGSKVHNQWIRELNSRMQQSGFSPHKFVLIENIQRMSISAMNAFLKTSEEPLPNRFIIATVPHSSQLLDTIISRSIQINFPYPAEQEMLTFPDISADLQIDIKNLIQNLSSPDSSKVQAFWLLKKLANNGILDSFIDGRIAHEISQNHSFSASPRLKFKKLSQANISIDNLLRYSLTKKN